MSVQRFRVYDEDEVLPVENGEFVTYADHVAAVAEAEQRGRSKQRVIDEARFNYDRGVDAARDAVAAVDWVEAALAPIPTALAAIDALRGAE